MVGRFRPNLLSGILEPLLSLSVLGDSGSAIGLVYLRGLHEIVSRIQPAVHAGKPLLLGPKLLVLLARHSVNLLAHDVRQAADVSVCADSCLQPQGRRGGARPPA